MGLLATDVKPVLRDCVVLVWRASLPDAADDDAGECAGEDPRLRLELMLCRKIIHRTKIKR